MYNMLVFVQDYLKPEFSGKKLSILDVGSRDINGGYRKLFEGEPHWTYMGLDIIEGENVDIVVKNIYSWYKIRDNRYDVVVCGQVFEHIEYPWLTIKEIARVLKPGGLLCLIAPSAGPEHRYPVDCYRYFPDGFKALAKWANLEVVAAYNCWDVPDMENEKNHWKDNVLIAKKPLNLKP
jgi:SAM-dependent methyltransferase